MSLDITAGAQTPAPLPLQFLDIKITPIIDGQFSVAMMATLLDEERFEFVSEDLADARVDTLEEALALIGNNVGALARHAA
jgi:hypothetical protein